ncbi:aldo/keto reductase [candidate division CSSED10-310 bacterium]|uniref:Aldo/keto reductase n=1 Tax=candidate division CSSED10-310 bacterium TaxID=2855610 RepID=A0ABV6YW65_UNCC1
MVAQRLSKERRKFMKNSLTGLAGITVLPTLITPAAGSDPPVKQAASKIIYRKLGKTGLTLPIVSMGVMNSDNPDLVKAALEAGITHLDTAHGYQRGRNEEMIGQVIKGRPRDSFVLATKVPGRPYDRRTGLFSKNATAGPFLEKFETSLKRLGLDHVDILYLHSVVKKESVMFEPFLNAMLKLKKDGKVRFIGVSTHSNEPEVVRAAADSKVHDVVLTAYNFLQPHREEVKNAIAHAAQAGLGIVAMKTQAGVYWDRERQKMINMSAALKWVLNDENVHTSIPGITTFDQLKLNLSVMADLNMSPQENKDLEHGPKVGRSGIYCQQCGTCVAQCKEKIDIPTMMRSYMYAYGYKNFRQAKETLGAENFHTSLCRDCHSCQVNCTMGFNVQQKIMDIARIISVPDDFLG